MPTVSVIINCFNESEFVGEAIDSVFAQTFQDWEIVFWDNASSDGSGDIAAGYGNKVRCFRSDEMVQLGTARKLAFEQTRGEYVAILDADDVWLPEKLESQVDLFQNNSDVGMVYCDVTYFDDQGDSERLFQLVDPHRGDIFEHLISQNFMFSSAMIFRRSALDELGCAFDDSYARAQDYDLTLRLAYDFQVDYVNKPLAKWRFVGVEDKPWKKTLVSRVSEVKRSFESLIAEHPEISTKYSIQIKEFYKQLDYLAGVTAWRECKAVEARYHLRKHLRDKKFFIVFVCTYIVSHNLFYSVRLKIRNTTRGFI